MRRFLFAFLMCGLLVLGITEAALAHTPVARISLIQGEASLLRGDLDEWSAASVNTPLMAGDLVYAGEQSRMELTLAPGKFLRMAENTTAEILNFTPSLAQIKLAQGTATLFAHRFDQSRALEIDTPNVAITILRGGLYRVDVDEDGNTTISVWKGEVEANANGSRVLVHSRESISIDGVHNPQYEINIVAIEDAWDLWNIERNGRLERRQVRRYVNDDIYGTEDLEEYGRWVSVPTYGRAWAPVGIGPDWAPYSHGRWIWQDPFGWTWVSNEPWGWAPYHYGRWAYFPTIGWAWVPQPRYITPYYAPALVSFVSSGPDFSLAVSTGPALRPHFVGWFPLSPRDVYVPHYAAPHYVTPAVSIGVATPGFAFSLYFNKAAPYYYNAGFAGVPVHRTPSTTIINQYNYTTIKNISITKNVYINKTVRNAVITTTPGGFRRGEIERVRVETREIKEARVVHEVLPIAPTSESLAASRGGHRHRSTPSDKIIKRPVVAINSPAPAPTPFDEKIKEIEANKSQPVLPVMDRKARREKVRGAGEGSDTPLTPVAPVRMAREPEPGSKPLVRSEKRLLRERRPIRMPVEAETAEGNDAKISSFPIGDRRDRVRDERRSGRISGQSRGREEFSQPAALEERLNPSGTQSGQSRDERTRQPGSREEMQNRPSTVERPAVEQDRRQMRSSGPGSRGERLSREQRDIEQPARILNQPVPDRQRFREGKVTQSQPSTVQPNEGQPEIRSERDDERAARPGSVERQQSVERPRSMERPRSVERQRRQPDLRRSTGQQAPSSPVAIPEGRIRPDVPSSGIPIQGEQAPAFSRPDKSGKNDGRSGRRGGEARSKDRVSREIKENRDSQIEPTDQEQQGQDESEPSEQRRGRRGRSR